MSAAISKRLGWLLVATALGGGCRQPQAKACQRLIACGGALVPEAQRELQRAYGKDAPCWDGRRMAAACADWCTEALKGLELHEHFSSVEACGERQDRRRATSRSTPSTSTRSDPAVGTGGSHLLEESAPQRPAPARLVDSQEMALPAQGSAGDAAF